MAKFVFVAIIFIILMVANHRVAKEKGRKSVLIWTAFGIFFPVFALFLNMVIPEEKAKA
ncbi:MAG: hypothetical protein LUE14_07880 [Clostridiales bacterium]|nr:hypothetical protein [Clostridiales bacterium]